MTIKNSTIADRCSSAFRSNSLIGHEQTSKDVSEYLENNRTFQGRILPRIELEFPWLHQRAASEADFREFCDRNAITVVFNKAIEAGIYVVYDGQHFIFLNPSPTSADLTYVMFHAIGLYLFHEPAKRSNGMVRKVDPGSSKYLEAHMFAAMAISPEPG